MTKKHFIALAERLANERIHGRLYMLSQEDFKDVVRVLADFCETQNPRFDPHKFTQFVFYQVNSWQEKDYT
jgi:hypothetical protein